MFREYWNSSSEAVTLLLKDKCGILGETWAQQKRGLHISGLARVQPSASEEMKQTFFPLFFPLNTTQNPKHYTEDKHKESLKSREKSDHWQGTLEPEVYIYGNEVPGFSFCFIYSRLGAKELTIQKHQQKQEKVKIKEPVLSNQRSMEVIA